MADQITQYLATSPWMFIALRILGYYLFAWLAAKMARRLVRRFIDLSRFNRWQEKPRPERQATLTSLLTSAAQLLVFLIATLLALSEFLQPDTLAWMVGLFSAAFGLGARPLISDYLSGLSFIFGDTFAVGEKIEILGPATVEGVVEKINLQTTSMRAATGELYVIPNGEIRMVRNFSRGKFSAVHVDLKISTADLGRTLALLDEIAPEAVLLLPNLLEPWQVYSKAGEIGQHTVLTLVARARFGMAGEMLPRILSLVQEKMAEAGIDLVA